MLPTTDGTGRCAVNEILPRTPGLPLVIREGDKPMIHSIIQAGRSAGMRAMDDALFALLQAPTILPQDAYLRAIDKPRFEALLPGGA